MVQLSWKWLEINLVFVFGVEMFKAPVAEFRSKIILFQHLDSVEMCNFNDSPKRPFERIYRTVQFFISWLDSIFMYAEIVKLYSIFINVLNNFLHF